LTPASKRENTVFVIDRIAIVVSLAIKYFQSMPYPRLGAPHFGNLCPREIVSDVNRTEIRRREITVITETLGTDVYTCSVDVKRAFNWVNARLASVVLGYMS
jgi:hypothetical protein